MEVERGGYLLFRTAEKVPVEKMEVEDQQIDASIKEKKEEIE